MPIITPVKRPSGISGPNLRAVREQYGMSRNELARLVGRTAGTVGRWEAGSLTPRPAERRLLAGILAKDVGDLFPMADPPVIAAARGVARAQSMVELRRAVIALQYEIDLLDERGAA